MIVISPFWSRDTVTATGEVLAIADAVKASASQVTNTLHLDLLKPNLEAPATSVSTTLAASTSIGATSVSATAAAASSATGYLPWILIGSDATQEIRRVTSSGGGTPQTLNFAAASGGGPGLAYAHAAGEPLVTIAPYFVTGTGNIGLGGSAGRIDITSALCPGSGGAALGGRV